MKNLLFPALPFTAAHLASPAGAEGGTLQITKECSEYTGAAGDFCTISASNFAAIPVGSKVVYALPAKDDGGLDTDIVVKTPNGDTVNGHVTLDGATETGTVTLSGGTGRLRTLAADLKVRALEAPTYGWSGPFAT